MSSQMAWHAGPIALLPGWHSPPFALGWMIFGVAGWRAHRVVTLLAP